MYVPSILICYLYNLQLPINTMADKVTLYVWKTTERNIPKGLNVSVYEVPFFLTSINSIKIHPSLPLPL